MNEEMTVSNQFEPRRTPPNAEYEWADRDGTLHTMKAELHPELGENYWAVQPRSAAEDAHAESRGLERARKLEASTKTADAPAATSKKGA